VRAGRGAIDPPMVGVCFLLWEIVFGLGEVTRVINDSLLYRGFWGTSAAYPSHVGVVSVSGRIEERFDQKWRGRGAT